MTAERSRQTAAWFAAPSPAQSRGGGRQPLAASDSFCVLPRPARSGWGSNWLPARPSFCPQRWGGAGAGSGVSGRHSPAPGAQLPPPLPAARLRAAGAEESGRAAPFLSRHALSAGVIAAVWLYFSPAAGAALTVVALVICGLRVLTGVHFVRDVAAGVTLGFALGLAGMWLL